MERGPLPPHERSWRHPSELGPPAHEPTSNVGRVIIVSTATLGMLLVGVLAISMTPRPGSSPQTAGSSLSTVRISAISVAAVSRPLLPLVTPVGDEGWAVTTADAISGDDGEHLWARLPTGGVVEVEIVNTDEAGELTVVSLPAAAAAEPYQLAKTEVAPSDTVLVAADDPMVVSMDELVHLDVAEATPVVDVDGRLLGLCTGTRDHRWIMPVEDVPDGDVATTASTATTSPATTVARSDDDASDGSD